MSQQYEAEFKNKIVRLHLEEGRTLKSLQDEYKVWIVNTFLYNFYSVIFVRRYSTGVMYSKVL